MPRSSAGALNRGRTIEEIMIRRKIDGFDPTTWPESQRLPPESTRLSGKTFASKKASPIRSPHKLLQSPTPSQNSSPMPMRRRMSPGTGSRPGTAEVNIASANATRRPSTGANQRFEDAKQKKCELEMQREEEMLALLHYVDTVQKRVDELESIAMESDQMRGALTRKKAIENAKLTGTFRPTTAELSRSVSHIDGLKRDVSSKGRSRQGGSPERRMSTKERQERRASRRLSASFAGVLSDDQQVSQHPGFKIRHGSEYVVEVAEGMESIDNRVTHLKYLFKKQNPFDERNIAATRINTCVRRFLCRVRFAHYRRGLREWKWSRCRNIVYIMDVFLQNQSAFGARLEQFRVNREIRWIRLVYSRWLNSSKQSAPLRRQIRKEAELRFMTIQEKLMKSVFEALRAGTSGDLSRKTANRERKLLIENIRNELSAALVGRGELGVPLEQDVRQRYHRHLIADFRDRKSSQMMLRIVRQGFAENVRLARRNDAVAKKHWFRIRVGKCFSSWSSFTALVNAGIDRRLWAGPRKYIIRYNQKRVNYFARARILRYVWKPWAEYSKILVMVKHKHRRKTALFLKVHFEELRKVLKNQRRLRILAVDTWKDYPRVVTATPFHAWNNFVKGQKNKLNEQLRIVNSYTRWKRRTRLRIILKTWRHQALFGRLDGMYTRKMLIQSLAEQKQAASSMEKMLASATCELEECHKMVEKEIRRTRDLEARQGTISLEANRQRMIAHHAEQEIRRLETIIEAMLLINPKQMHHLQAMQIDFNFRQRNTEHLKTECSTNMSTEQPSTFEDESSAGGEGGEVLFNMDKSIAQGDTNSSLLSQDDNLKSDASKSGPLSPLGMARSLGSQMSRLGGGSHAISSGDVHGGDGTGYSMFSQQRPHVDPLSAFDRCLLQRARWIVSRFSTEALREFILNQQLQKEAAINSPGQQHKRLSMDDEDSQEGEEYVEGQGDSRRESLLEADYVGRDSEYRSVNGSRVGHGGSNAPNALPNSSDELSVAESVQLALERPDILPQAGNILVSAGNIGLPSEIQLQQTLSVENDSVSADPKADSGKPVGADMLDKSPRIGQNADQHRENEVDIQVLLGIIDFLASGDTNAFCAADKRDWIQSVVDSANEKQAMVSAGGGGDITDHSLHSNLDGQVSMGQSAVANPSAYVSPVRTSMHDHLAGKQVAAQHGLSREGTLGDADVMSRPQRVEYAGTTRSVGSSADSGVVLAPDHGLEEAIREVAPPTWAQALLHLRTMFPNAGNMSGLGKPLEDDPHSVHKSVLRMRETIAETMARQVVKHSHLDPYKDIKNEAIPRPVNVYAGNMAKVLRNADEIRKDHKREAKEAKRAAEAAGAPDENDGGSPSAKKADGY